MLFIFRSIRRVIFYSLIKPILNEKGEKEMDTISVSQALQIAGRAGRYGTQYEKVRRFNSFLLLMIKLHVNCTYTSFDLSFLFFTTFSLAPVCL